MGPEESLKGGLVGGFRDITLFLSHELDIPLWDLS